MIKKAMFLINFQNFFWQIQLYKLNSIHSNKKKLLDKKIKEK